MGRKHFTEEQIAFAQRQHDGGTAETQTVPISSLPQWTGAGSNRRHTDFQPTRAGAKKARFSRTISRF
jgi:hypothetical protein